MCAAVTLQSLQEIKHTVRNVSMCHHPNASEQNVVYYSLKECLDFWAHFKRCFYRSRSFCSFPLVLIATSECARGFVCTETCKLICPHVNKYKILSTRWKEAYPAETFLTCCLVKMTFTNLFSRKVLIWKKLLTQINDRNNNVSLSGPLLKVNSEGLCQLTFARSFGPSGKYVSLSLEIAFIAKICTCAHIHSRPLPCSC